MTEISVEWKDLCFNVSLKNLARLGVHNRVAQIISQMFDCISKFHGTPSICYLIPLSTHD